MESVRTYLYAHTLLIGWQRVVLPDYSQWTIDNGPRTTVNGQQTTDHGQRALRGVCAGRGNLWNLFNLLILIYQQGCMDSTCWLCRMEKQ